VPDLGSSPQIPEAIADKAVAEAMRARRGWHSGVRVNIDVPEATRIRADLNAAYPHLFAAFSERLEEMIKACELNSHDVGWAVPTTDLESFLDRQLATLNVSGGGER